MGMVVGASFRIEWHSSRGVWPKEQRGVSGCSWDVARMADLAANVFTSLLAFLSLIPR